MSYELPEEIKALKQRARDFSDSVLLPLEKEWPHHTEDFAIEKKKALGRKAKEAKLLGAGRPKKLGGLGLGVLGSMVVIEELARTPPGFSTFYDVGFPYFLEPAPVFFDAPDYIKDNYTARMVDDGEVYCLMMTEPQSGSDFSGIKTTALREGDNYIINGKKIFPTAYKWASFCIVWAKLIGRDGNLELDAHGRPQITTFLVDSDNPNMKVTKWVDVLGIDWEPEVEFTDCVTPAKNILGDIGGGMAVGRGQMNRARISWGAAATGASQRCLELAVKYAKERRAFGREIGSLQAIQWWLADSYMELEAMRQLTYYNAATADRNNDLQKATSQARSAVTKLFCLERGLEIIDRAMKTHGAIGMTGEYPFDYLYRQLRSARAAEGSPEIMRHVIATHLLGKDVTRLRRD